jgi:uncharacterized protein YcbK (DUF882 family)
MSLGWATPALTALCAGIAASTVATPVPRESRTEHSLGLATKKSLEGPSPHESPKLLGTLVDTHSDARVPVDEESPTSRELDHLLSDRVTGSEMELDRRLYDLLRALTRLHPGATIELVSGYRSPKLNEMLRKKGHHVASHSQHSLGHAVDFRVVPAAWPEGAIGPPAVPEPLDPLELEREIRGLGWEGGTGVYLSKDDRFVHADVGPNRRWNGL